MPTPTKGPRLGGGPSHERMLIANLARSLFVEGRIRTTQAKAKRLRPQAERLITFAKRGDIASRRQVLTVVRDKQVVHKLFAEIAPRYADRHGGYTRILKLGPRPGDSAPMALIELVDLDAGEIKEAGGGEAGRRRRFGRRRARPGASDLGPRPGDSAPMALIELVDLDAGEIKEAGGGEAGRRRRFGRRRARPGEAAPEGANRAQRRAAARRRHVEEAEDVDAALAGESAEDEERPDVPTDAEIEAGVPAAGVDEADEDAEALDEDAEVDEAEGEARAEAAEDEAATPEASAEADQAEAGEAQDEDGKDDGGKG